MTYKAPSSTTTEPGLITLAGDLGGTATSPTVNSISGSSPIALTPATLQWISGTSSPTIKQADNTTNSATATNLTIQSQNATGTTSIGGNLILKSGTGTSTNGTVLIEPGGVTTLLADITGVVLGKTASSNSGTRIAPLIGSETVFSGIWVGSNAASPSSSNYTLALSPTSGFITASNAGVMNWTSSLLTVTVPNIQWASATSSPTINQGNPTSASGQNLTITAQAGNGSGNNGGNLVLNGGASGGGSGTKGQVQISSQIQLQTNVMNDATATATTTTDGTLTTIYTDSAIPASTCYDFVVTVVGKDTSQNCYRADFSFTYVRIGSAAPTAVGATAVPLNVRTSGTASGWGGASISLSSNSVIVQVTGAVSTTISWNCSFNRILV